MFTIIDEHAWCRDGSYNAEIMLLDEKNKEYLVKGVSGTTDLYTVISKEADTCLVAGNTLVADTSMAAVHSIEIGSFISTDYSLSEIESYSDYELTKDSEFADYFHIVKRMIDELKGKITRTRYRIMEKRTRMTDNIFEKIPEGEIEISFPNGEFLFLFAYEAASYAEYGISKISWLDQSEEGEKVDRKEHILESYDSLQDSLHSAYAPLFLELYEMLQNAEDMPDEVFGDLEELDEDGEPILPGFYQY